MLNMNEDRLTIIIDSFDGYSDVWDYFYILFKKYWPDCSYDIKLISNNLDYKNIQTIKTGDEEDWVSRTKRALDEVNSDYILLLLEDYFLSKYITNSFFSSFFQLALDSDADYLRLIEIPKSRVKDKKKILLPILSNEEYGINLQASIWKKSFLVNNLNEINHGSAWDFEIYFLKKTQCEKQHNYLPRCFTLRGNVFGFHNGILKGKWFRREIKFYSKKGIKIDYKKRGRISFFQERKYILSQFVKSHSSYKVRKLIKRLLKKMGWKFASDI